MNIKTCGGFWETLSSKRDNRQVLLDPFDMPHDAATIATAVLQAAARPGVATRRLDAVDEANTIALGTQIPLGADLRGNNGRAKGFKDKGKPSIDKLRAALTLFVTTNVNGTHPGDKKSQSVAGRTHGIDQNDMCRMAKRLPDGTVAEQLLAISVLEWTKRGSPAVAARQFFTEDEENLIAAAIKLQCDMGFPLDVEGIGAYASDTLSKLGRGTDSWSGLPVVCGSSYVAGFLSRHPDLRKFKSSALDPLRSRQASRVARHAAPEFKPKARRNQSQSGREEGRV